MACTEVQRFQTDSNVSDVFLWGAFVHFCSLYIVRMCKCEWYKEDVVESS